MSTAKEQMLGSGLEILWRNMPDDFRRDADAYAALLRRVLAGYTGSWTVTPVEKIRIKKQGDVFTLRGVHGAGGGVVRVRCKPEGGSCGWNMNIIPPSTYSSTAVADKMQETLAKMDEEWEDEEMKPEMKPNGQISSRPAELVASLAPRPATPAPAKVAPPPPLEVSPDSVLDRVNRLHSMAHMHGVLNQKLKDAQLAKDAIWKSLESAEAEVARLQAAIDSDVEGKNAIAALLAIGGLLPAKGGA